MVVAIAVVAQALVRPQPVAEVEVLIPRTPTSSWFVVRGWWFVVSGSWLGVRGLGAVARSAKAAWWYLSFVSGARSR